MSTTQETIGSETLKLADAVRYARSMLVVPGHRPDRFAKAAASGADVIMLDLEDGVGPGRKPEARRHVAEWLAAGGSGIVRVNGFGTPWYADDLAMLAELSCVVMLPKTSNPAEAKHTIRSLAPESVLIPAFESATGILNVREICAAPGVVRVILGNADLAADLGIDLADRVALHNARSQLVLASAASQIAAPFDGVTVALDDDELLTRDAEHAAALGFTGKACLHPRQVPIVNAVFTPSEQDIEWAREVLAMIGDGSVTAVDHQVIGKPMVERARRLLAHLPSNA